MAASNELEKATVGINNVIIAKWGGKQAYDGIISLDSFRDDASGCMDACFTHQDECNYATLPLR